MHSMLVSICWRRGSTCCPATSTRPFNSRDKESRSQVSCLSWLDSGRPSDTSRQRYYRWLWSRMEAWAYLGKFYRFLPPEINFRKSVQYKSTCMSNGNRRNCKTLKLFPGYAPGWRRLSALHQTCDSCLTVDSAIEDYLLIC